MTGIKFIMDKNGKKSAVQIDLKKYKRIWEDLYDSIKAGSRKYEPRETLRSVKRRLKKSKA